MAEQKGELLLPFWCPLEKDSSGFHGGNPSFSSQFFRGWLLLRSLVALYWQIPLASSKPMSLLEALVALDTCDFPGDFPLPIHSSSLSSSGSSEEHVSPPPSLFHPLSFSGFCLSVDICLEPSLWTSPFLSWLHPDSWPKAWHHPQVCSACVCPAFASSASCNEALHRHDS